MRRSGRLDLLEKTIRCSIRCSVVLQPAWFCALWSVSFLLVIVSCEDKSQHTYVSWDSYEPFPNHSLAQPGMLGRIWPSSDFQCSPLYSCRPLWFCKAERRFLLCLVTQYLCTPSLWICQERVGSWSLLTWYSCSVHITWFLYKVWTSILEK